MARWKWRILILPSVLPRSFLLSSSSSFYIGPRAERATQSLPEPLLLSGDSFLDDGGTYAAYDSRKELPSRVTPPPPFPLPLLQPRPVASEKERHGEKEGENFASPPSTFSRTRVPGRSQLGKREGVRDAATRRILRVTGVAASRENAPRKNA